EKDQQALEAGWIGGFRMKVFLDEIPDHSNHKHQVNEGRDQRKQNLEDEDVGKCDETQGTFAREHALMLKDGLQNSERPAKALAHERVGTGRSLGEGEGQVFVFHAIAVAQERHSQIGVFGDGVHVVAARFADRRGTPGADRARHHAHRAHGIERSPLKILAGDVFERLPARPEVHAVPNLGVAGHGRNFRIEEVGHEAGDGIRGNNGIGIDANEEFGIADVLQSEVQRLGFAAVGPGENQYTAGSFFSGKGAAGDFQSAILGTVIDDDHAQIGIVGIECALDRAFDDLFLVIGGNEHRDAWPVGCNLLGRSIDMRAKAVVNGEDADRNQAPGHQNVTQEENDRDARHGCTEEPEADPIEAGGPIFVGREWRHNIGFGFAHQLVYGDKIKSAGTGAIDNQRERQYGSFPVPAAIVHENDVAALLVVRLARGQVVEHAGGDLPGRERGLVAPVPGVDLVANGDIAQALGEFERLDLVFGVGLGIDGVRRTEQRGANAQLAGEQLLGQIQLHSHVARANRADIGMSKGMVPDFVTFAVNALGQTAEFLRLDSDQKECSRHVLAFEDVENFRRPLRIGAVVEGHGEVVLAETIARDTIGFGQTLEVFAIDESGLLIDGQLALAVGRPRLNVKDFAAAFHVDVLAGRNVLQSIRRIGFSGHIPHTPQGAVFGAQPPQGEGLNAERLCGTHLVEGSHRIQKPDIVAEVIVVLVAEMRVKCVAVKINVLLGIARSDPGFLHGNALVGLSRRQFAFFCFWLLHPVVPVVANGANELFFWNLLDRRLKVVREPILGRDRARGSAGKVLVVVHDDDAIHGGRNSGVIVILVPHLDADVELQSLGVQVGRKLVEQSYVSGLAFFRKGFEVDHQAAIMVGGKKKPDLASESGARFWIVQKIDNAGNKVGAVKILHYGKHFHLRVFRL